MINGSPNSQTILVGGGIVGVSAAIAIPCPLDQTNVEMFQEQTNKKFGTSFNIPVVFYSQLMALAFGMDADKDAALNQNIIKADALKAKAK